MTKKEFIDLEINKQSRKNIMICGIFCYVLAAFNLILYFAVPEMGAGVLDAVLLLVFGLVIHLRKSFVASVIFAVYSVVNIIFVFMMTGNFGGWLIAIAAFSAVAETYKLNKAWKEFQAGQNGQNVQYIQNGQTPQNGQYMQNGQYVQTPQNGQAPQYGQYVQNGQAPQYGQHVQNGQVPQNGQIDQDAVNAQYWRDLQNGQNGQNGQNNGPQA